MSIKIYKKKNIYLCAKKKIDKNIYRVKLVPFSMQLENLSHYIFSIKYVCIGINRTSVAGIYRDSSGLDFRARVKGRVGVRVGVWFR